ncbi:MAG TPA: hypothetical protein VJ256_04190 [Dehalococcoidia bacterium]|nr:hypothetical protein [Dehalococcoidia bacterium]HLB29376.1 hypothetical protein [Dehalococcoidia bacterium]
MAESSEEKAISPSETPEDVEGREEESQGPSEDVGFLFRDPCWDDAFGSYYNLTLRLCCTID